jgi:hypothetical protein
MIYMIYDIYIYTPVIVIRFYGMAPGLSELAGHLAGPWLGSQQVDPAAGAPRRAEKWLALNGEPPGKTAGFLWEKYGKIWKKMGFYRKTMDNSVAGWWFFRTWLDDFSIDWEE